MKKWHIVLLIAILSVAVIVASVFGVYKYYITPRYIEPIVEEISDYVNHEDILDSLYDEAVVLREEGVIEDTTYSKFVRAYNEYKRDDVEYAKRVMEEYDTQEPTESQSNSLSTKYASYKVGVETIKVNDGDQSGKAETQYSDERTSDRIKANDVIEAEKILEEEEKTHNATPTPDVVKSAYEKLRVNMSSDEFSKFTKIMSKLDMGTLKTYISDKEGLKAYLHENLTDEEYSTAVNLGYKYVYVLMEK